MLHTKNKPVAPVPGRVVGTRKPAPLGLAVRAGSTPVVVPAASSKQYHVVSKGFALPLQGYSATASKRGNATLYGVFATHAQAVSYVKSNKMQLFTSIVAM